MGGLLSIQSKVWRRVLHFQLFRECRSCIFCKSLHGKFKSSKSKVTAMWSHCHHFHALLPHNTTMADILSRDLGLHVEMQICVYSSSCSSLLGCQPCGLHINQMFSKFDELNAVFLQSCEPVSTARAFRQK